MMAAPTETKMRYRPLGRSGLSVSELGFGTWGLGGNKGSVPAYGPTDDRTSRAALARALELGINFFDTADLYGNGHSETLLGRACAGQRSHVVLATKAGLVNGGAAHNFTPLYLQRSLRASLKRLQTDYIDLFLLHNPPVSLATTAPKLWSYLNGLKERGLARSVGVSLAGPEDGLVFACRPEIDAVQVNYNLLDQRASDCGLLDLCQSRGIGVIARTPLCFGFLSGQPAQGSFGQDDHRRRWSASQQLRWQEGGKLFQPYHKPGETSAQFALRFCLAASSIATTIPGMMNFAEVEENVAACLREPLEPRTLKQIASLYAQHSFFLGKRQGA
ncbi:MAG: aldo/keto reductase [Gemmataceae bacterium]